MNARDPLTVIENATAYYYEGGDEPVRHEGKVELYDSWVYLADGPGTWVPREQIEQIHDF